MEALADIRARVAADRSATPQEVLGDRALERVVAAMPSTLEELGLVEGVDPRFAEQCWTEVAGVFRTPSAEAGIEAGVAGFSLF
jgi:ribonuclease D